MKLIRPSYQQLRSTETVTREFDQAFQEFASREPEPISLGDFEMPGHPTRNPALEIRIPHVGFAHRMAAGKARSDSEAAMTADHQIHLASVGKLMTATLILQLWEDGAFGSDGLDIPLSKLDVFEPAVLKRLHPEAAKITIRHLLCHTSGMKSCIGHGTEDSEDEVDQENADPLSVPGSIWSAVIKDFTTKLRRVEENPDADLSDLRMIQDAVHWDPKRPDDKDAGILNYFLNVLADSPLFSPGQEFFYSDTGYYILALVSEKISGKSYHRQQRERIFDPVGMDRTYMPYSEDPNPAPWEFEVSDCYLGEIPLVSNGFNFSFDWGGGGQISTVGDLNRFMEGLITGKLLPKAGTLEEMTNWRETPPEMGMSGIGLSLMRSELAGAELWGHGGGWGAFTYYEPKTGTYYSGTSNQLYCPPTTWLAPFIDTVHEGME